VKHACGSQTPKLKVSIDHPKSIIWKEIIFTFLWPTIEIADIVEAVLSLDFYNVRYCQKSNISGPMVIYITLANIWKAHFRSLIDGIPFLWPSVVSLIRQDIAKHGQEDQIHFLL
jgi:hypothetical protein